MIVSDGHKVPLDKYIEMQNAVEFQTRRDLVHGVLKDHTTKGKSKLTKQHECGSNVASPSLAGI